MILTKAQQQRLPTGYYVRDDGPPKKPTNFQFKVCEPFVMGAIVHGQGNTVEEAIADALKPGV